MILKKLWGKFTMLLKWYLFKIAKNWVCLNVISYRLRPILWKMTGVKITGKIKIGYDVYYDIGHTANIIIEDGVWIASRTLLLCHKRDLRNYYVGDDYNKQPHVKSNIVLKKGCCVGMASVIMPGVTIGEGAIVGAGSIVTKDVPAWTIVTGNPAKVVKELKTREC